MRSTAQHYHAPLFSKLWQQASHQHKVADMIGEKLQLKPVPLFQPRQGHDARIADERVQLDPQLHHIRNASADAGRIR